FRDPEFRRMLTAMAVFQFSLGIVAPFVAAYMLRNLGLSYMQFSAFSILSLVVGILFNRFWGHLLDVVGIKSATMVTGTLVGIIPFFHILSLTYGLPMIF